MRARVLLAGVGIWILGTAGVRASGPHLLHPGRPAPTLLLYLASFVVMAWLVPRLSRRLNVPAEARFEALALLMLPTLALDPFSCVFFTTVFPNVDPAAAGLFGGWMLICCSGAVSGVLAPR